MLVKKQFFNTIRESFSQATSTKNYCLKIYKINYRNHIKPQNNLSCVLEQAVCKPHKKITGYHLKD